MTTKRRSSRSAAGKVASFKLPRHVVFIDEFPMTGVREDPQGGVARRGQAAARTGSRSGVLGSCENAPWPPRRHSPLSARWPRRHARTRPTSMASPTSCRCAMARTSAISAMPIRRPRRAAPCGCPKWAPSTTTMRSSKSGASPPASAPWAAWCTTACSKTASTSPQAPTSASPTVSRSRRTTGGRPSAYARGHAGTTDDRSPWTTCCSPSRPSASTAPWRCAPPWPT